MPAPTASPCEGCDGRCCRTYLVQLTGDDAWRLAAGLGLDLRSAVSFRPQHVPDDGGFVLAPDGPPHELALRRRVDAEGREGCEFLQESGRCGIYPFRPRACRRFPAVARDGGVGAREDIVCGPGAWTSEMLRRRTWRAELAREARESALYAVVVADWNARVREGRRRREADEFVDHVAEAYAWIAHLRSSLRPRERSGPAFLARVWKTLRELPAR